jgi:acyl-homoserine lactone synthase
MIHVVSADNRHAYQSEMLEHFRIRHDVYVGERKWTNLARPDGLERDQFDNDDAVYLLAIDNGHVVGGSRFVPTLKPHLLSEVYPHLIHGELPRAPDIWEWTRVFVVKSRREGRNGGRIAGQVYCGIAEFCLRNGISALTVLIEMWWFPIFQEIGWPLRPLGLPELLDNEWAVPVIMPMAESVLASTRAFYGIDGSVLVEAEMAVQ